MMLDKIWMSTRRWLLSIPKLRCAPMINRSNFAKLIDRIKLVNYYN